MRVTLDGHDQGLIDIDGLLAQGGEAGAGGIRGIRGDKGSVRPGKAACSSGWESRLGNREVKREVKGRVESRSPIAVAVA